MGPKEPHPHDGKSHNEPAAEEEPAHSEQGSSQFQTPLPSVRLSPDQSRRLAANAGEYPHYRKRELAYAGNPNRPFRFSTFNCSNVPRQARGGTEIDESSTIAIEHT
jgi:hypothetical protein